MILKKLLHDFDYTPSLLYELTKIIFVKSTTETHYLEYYVKLCIDLFKRFNDADNPEMNFRKLLLTRCEKHFNKMLQSGTLKKGIRLSKHNITFMFDLKDVELKNEGKTLGIDIGQTTTLSCSDEFNLSVNSLLLDLSLLLLLLNCYNLFLLFYQHIIINSFITLRN